MRQVIFIYISRKVEKITVDEYLQSVSFQGYYGFPFLFYVGEHVGSGPLKHHDMKRMRIVIALTM